MIAIILTDVAGIAAEMECEQPIVDRNRIKLTENVRVTWPDRDTTPGGAAVAKILIEPFGNDRDDGAGPLRTCGRRSCGHAR